MFSDDIFGAPSAISLMDWLLPPGLLLEISMLSIFLSERMGGDQSWPAYMDELNNCCNFSSLDDLRFSVSFKPGLKALAGLIWLGNLIEPW